MSVRVKAAGDLHPLPHTHTQEP